MSQELLKVCTLFFGLVLVEGCPSPTQLPERIEGRILCARLYDTGTDAIPCGGTHLNVFDGTERCSVGTFDNKASALVVVPKCRLDVHENHNHEGKIHRFGDWSDTDGHVAGNLQRVIRHKGKRCKNVCKGWWWGRKCHNQCHDYTETWDNVISSLICTCNPYK